MLSKEPLGKGLSSLISNTTRLNLKDEGFNPEISIDTIELNPHQPRKHFNEEKLQELANSIKENGFITPILVTRLKGKHGKYQLVAGERRLKAAELAGIKTVPAVIKDLSDKKVFLLALMENLQRVDLTILEEVEALFQLKEVYKLSSAALSKELGVNDRTTQAKIRIHYLPLEVKNMVEQGLLGTKQAMLLGRVENDADAIEAANIIIKQRMSSKECEDFIKRFMIEHPMKSARRQFQDKYNKVTFKYEAEFKRLIGNDYRVVLKRTLNGGSLIIKYKSDEELEALQKKLEPINPL